jgi:tetratricopeptide (TPR) repeat protein
MKSAVLALLLVSSQEAFAAPRKTAPAADVTREAKARFKKGSELYREARYREAIVEFEAAMRLRPHGVIHYNLAQCHERLGDIPAALRAYHEYLRAVPQAEDRATVQAAMANLEARLGALGVQQLLVYSEPPGAEVVIDGQSRGRTPFAAVLPHGAHAMSLEKEGWATVRREVVLADRSVQLEVALTRAQPGARASGIANPNPTTTTNPDAATSSAAPATAGSATASRELTPPPALGTNPLPLQPLLREARPGPRPRVWTWVAAGVAGAALAAGAAYGLSARSASDELRAAQRDGASAQRLADQASSRARSANVLYGVAAAAGAAGVTLFFVEGRF